MLTWNGRIAVTYYSSSTGGRTEANTDAWPGSQPVPYLMSVSDPYETLSPYHRWPTAVFTAAGLRRRLELGTVLDVRTVTAPSGWALQVKVTTDQGERTLTADEFKRRLGLRSTNFDVGVLGLVASQQQTVFGHSVPLKALVRGLHPVLQSRRAGTGWHDSPRLGTAEGAVTIGVEPTRTTSYRLKTPTAVTPAVTVAVTPAITVQGHSDGLSGRVRPGNADLAVALERRVAANWLTIRTTRAAGNGRFQLPQPHVDGLYRISTSGTTELLAGTSTPFTLHPGSD